MLDLQQEQKLQRLLEAIDPPDPESKESGGTSREQKRDDQGRFEAETSPVESKSKSVEWMKINDHTYVRQEWPVWSDVLFIIAVIGVVWMVF